jgi:hypothetical protein
MKESGNKKYISFLDVFRQGIEHFIIISGRREMTGKLQQGSDSLLRILDLIKSITQFLKMKRIRPFKN